jgi:hypothetical protein
MFEVFESFAGTKPKRVADMLVNETGNTLAD